MNALLPSRESDLHERFPLAALHSRQEFYMTKDGCRLRNDDALSIFFNQGKRIVMNLLPGYRAGNGLDFLQ